MGCRSYCVVELVIIKGVRRGKSRKNTAGNGKAGLRGLQKERRQNIVGLSSECRGNSGAGHRDIMASRACPSTGMIPTEGFLGPLSLHGCGAITEYLSVTCIFMPRAMRGNTTATATVVSLRLASSPPARLTPCLRLCRRARKPAAAGRRWACACIRATHRVMRASSVPIEVKVCVYALHPLAATQQQQLAMYVWTEYCKVSISGYVGGRPWNAAELQNPPTGSVYDPNTPYWARSSSSCCFVLLSCSQ